MSLKGIDISNYQPNIDLRNVAGDFAIMKATEGVGYVSPSCEKQYQQARATNKLRGVYHFARNSTNSSDAEATFFVNNIRGYLADPECILVLDWEDSNKGDVAWALRWLQKVEQLTGKKPLIYMSESVVNSYDWSAVAANNNGLWVAKYRDNVADFNYDMAQAGTPPAVKYWKFYAMWQWTSTGRINGYDGNLDCNEFYGDRGTWSAYAGGAGSPAPTPSPSPAPAPAPAPAQENVYVVKSGDTLSGIAAKYNTTYQNLAAINGIANPNMISVGQRIRVPGAQPAPTQRTVTVQRGDTLGAIASRNGTTWQVLKSINGIPNENIIYPGQVIRLP